MKLKISPKMNSEEPVVIIKMSLAEARDLFDELQHDIEETKACNSLNDLFSNSKEITLYGI